MKKIIISFFGLVFVLSAFATPVFGQTTSTSTAQELIKTLQQQIVALKAELQTLQAKAEELRQAQQDVKETVQETKTTLKLLRQLKKGMSGEDVKLLQETLATDPEIYPEGLVTGYFGPLTEKAVKKFQQKAGFDQVGAAGPKTLAKVNELLKEGAGSSGKVPPGLLIAPGIKEKLGFSPQPLPGQKLPPGIEKKIKKATTTDEVAPVISELSATSTGATSTNIVWKTNELADSNVWYSTSTPLVIATSTPTVSSSDLVLEHSQILSDLTASTTYYYLVSSADAAGNTASSSESSFTTLPQSVRQTPLSTFPCSI